MYHRPFSSASAAVVLSTVFLCLGYAGTLNAQDRPRLLDEPNLLDSRMDLISQELHDPHRGETFPKDGDFNTAMLQLEFAPMIEAMREAFKAGDTQKVQFLQEEFDRRMQEKLRQVGNPAARPSANRKHLTLPVRKIKGGSAGNDQPPGPRPEQIRALHEAVERLQNSGLPEIAQELRQRAEMMEKEMIVHREHMERAEKELISQKEKAVHDELNAQNRMIAHKEQLERHRIESDSGSQKQE